MARLAHAEGLGANLAKETLERLMSASFDGPAEQHEIEIAVEHVTGGAARRCFGVDGATDGPRIATQVKERSVRDESRSVSEQLVERDVVARKIAQPRRDRIREAPLARLDELQRNRGARDDFAERREVVD